MSEEKEYEMRICDLGINVCTNGYAIIDTAGEEITDLDEMKQWIRMWNYYVRHVGPGAFENCKCDLRVMDVDAVLEFARNIIDIYEETNILSIELVRAFAKIKLMLDVARALLREPEMIRRLPSEFKKLDEFLDAFREKDKRGGD